MAPLSAPVFDPTIVSEYAPRSFIKFLLKRTMP